MVSTITISKLNYESLQVTINNLLSQKGFKAQGPTNLESTWLRPLTHGMGLRVDEV